MKSRSEVRQKLKQAQFRHVKRVLRETFPEGEDWPAEEVARIKDHYREFFLSASLHEVAHRFPDVAALLWVLDERPEDSWAPNGSMVGSMGGVLLWADTDEEAGYARSLIERIMEEAVRNPSPPDPQLPAVKQSWWQRIFG